MVNDDLRKLWERMGLMAIEPMTIGSHGLAFVNKKSL